MIRRFAGWAAFGAIVLVAMGRAATAASLPDARPASEDMQKEVFALLAAEERTMRRDAAKDFPADAWSQDDAFHNLEYKRARTLAGERGVRFSDVLLAIDEGMHQKWPHVSDAWQKPTVPPCRPRPIH
jgi:hypothetical protein